MNMGTDNLTSLQSELTRLREQIVSRDRQLVSEHVRRDNLLSQVNTQQDHNSRLEAVLKKERQLVESLRQQLQHVPQLHMTIQALKTQLQSIHVGAQARENKFNVELKQSNDELAALKRKDREAQWAAFKRDCSREDPDDALQGDIWSFMNGIFNSWCCELAVADGQNFAQQISQPESAESLRRICIMGEGQADVDELKHGQLDKAHISTPMYLLHGALASALCEAFLTTPYFLSQEHGSQYGVEGNFPKEQREVLINSRIQIVQDLEKKATLEGNATPNRKLYEAKARLFEQQFGFLLKEFTEPDDHEDLVEIFSSFASIALRLWKLPTTITVLGMPQLRTEGIQAGSGRWEIRSYGPTKQSPKSLSSAVLMNPLIISKPIMPEGKPQREVVMCKGLVGFPLDLV